MNYFSKLADLFTETKEQYERLNGLQSALDRKVSEAYHTLEKSEELTAEESCEFTKKLKQTLQYRRVIKQEIALVLPVYLSLKDQVGKVEEQHLRAVRKSMEIQQSLNVTLELCEVLEALEAN